MQVIHRVGQELISRTAIRRVMSVRFSLRCRIVVTVLFAALAVPVQATSLPSFDRVRIFDDPRPIGDFDLTNQEGQPVSFSDFRDHVVLVFFGFTHCPDICPATMTRLQQFQSASGESFSALRYVLISVDGDRDSPQVVKKFLARFSSDFTGLTGDPQAVNAIAALFRAPFYKGHDTGVPPGYTVAHSPQVFVIDKAGDLRAEFYNASFDAMAAIIAVLEAEPGTDLADNAGND